MHRIKALLLFCSILLLNNCFEKSKNDIIVENFIIYEKGNSEQIFYVKNVENLIYSEPGTAPLALIAGFSIAKDTIFVFDHTLFNIYKYDLEGNLLDRIKLRQGRGPGELEHPISFLADENYFYFFDQSNLKYLFLKTPN